MDAPVPLIFVALLAALALVAPTARIRAWAMLGALAIAPVILVFHISDSDQFRALTDRPTLAAAAAVGAVVVVLALAWAIHRWPSLLPVLAVAAVPFRVPIALGGTTANLLVPLYGVVAAGVLAYAIPRLGESEAEAHRVSPTTASVPAPPWTGASSGGMMEPWLCSKASSPRSRLRSTLPARSTRQRSSATSPRTSTQACTAWSPTARWARRAA